MKLVMFESLFEEVELERDAGGRGGTSDRS